MEQPTDRIGDYVDLAFKMQSNEISAAIQRDFGLYYKRRHMIPKALTSFANSLDYDPDGYESQLQNVNCQLELANIDGATESVVAVKEAFPDRLPVHYAHENCIYEQNKFERSLIECRNVERRFRPKNKLPLLGPSLVQTTIKASIGPEVGQCLLDMRYDIKKWIAHEENRRPDCGQLWKQRLEYGECDVISLFEAPAHYEGPLERNRKARKRTLMNSLYLGPGMADDIDFLQSLRNDRRLVLPQCSLRAAETQAVVDTCTSRVDIWKKQLWHRKPVYAKRSAGNESFRRSQSEAALRRLQYQTRRDVFRQLDYIRANIDRNLETTLQFIDHTISTYYAIKTKRIFPRKDEFVRIIFGLIGQALVKRCFNVPLDLMTFPVPERFQTLIQVPPELKSPEGKTNDAFGDRTKFVDPDVMDPTFLKHRNQLRHYELRLKHSIYPEERSYLLYQIAHLLMSIRKFHESVEMGRRMLDEAKGNMDFTLLGYLTAIRADCLSFQFAKAGVKMDRMLNSSCYAKCNDKTVLHFCKVAQVVYSELMDIEDPERAMDAKRTRTSTKRRKALLRPSSKKLVSFITS